MGITNLLFGKWEQIISVESTATVGGIITPESELAGLVVVEENTRTHKRRAYFKSLDGYKRTLDYDIVKLQLGNRIP